MQSLHKALRVLQAFDQNTPEWGVRELAAWLRQPRSSVQVYLAALCNNQMLRRTPTGRYRLSWHTLEFATRLHGGLEWFGEAQQQMQHLAAKTQSLGVLALLEQEHVVCVARSNHDPKLKHKHVQTDVYLPAHATATGKVLHAHHALPVPKLVRFTKHTCCRLQAWQDALEVTRTQGHGVALEEWHLGQCALAIPVVVGDVVVASIGLQVSAQRFDKERFFLTREMQRGQDVLQQRL